MLVVVPEKRSRSSSNPSNWGSIISRISFLSVIVALVALSACAAEGRERIVLPATEIGQETRYSQEELDELLRAELGGFLREVSPINEQGFCCLLIGREAQAVAIAVQIFGEHFPQSLDDYAAQVTFTPETYIVTFIPRYRSENQEYINGMWVPGEVDLQEPSFFVEIDGQSMSVVRIGRPVE